MEERVQTSDSPSQVSAQLLLFGKIREMAGISETKIYTPAEIKCADLEELVFSKLEVIDEESRKSCLLAVNRKYCRDKNEILSLDEGTEIAIIPPLSGG